MRCAVWFAPDTETSADLRRFLLLFVCSVYGESQTGLKAAWVCESVRVCVCNVLID